MTPEILIKWGLAVVIVLFFLGIAAVTIRFLWNASWDDSDEE